ncbi:hypothetical protein FEDK69T_23440 [Flavobacterium enshiense DK69]|uniref:Phosphatidic acid phosphatase type 2/haloperoxidase domain-containing protein n=1 Tax=Flavobacterium enshiense DK69 TaxID=1107311 RepID=V6S7H0_9FLAO|nr:vanadium-dependent haloperoxidase [Flavobacterium enshiense]ESU22359.1 hypothetical protein FEDK69T_23440 [Flavobacterium enshiense DK69]KGO97362.1 hypothetical protein Q767_01830 [Flavobacterium enshiense DK69]
MKKSFTSLKLLLFVGLITLFSCRQEEIPTTSLSEEVNSEKFQNKNTSPEMVLRWNEAATYVVLQTQVAVPNPPIPPFIESRYYAMVNVAMHDALNNIVPKYKTLALKNSRDKDADPNAAVAQAAHDVIAYFFGKLNPPAMVTPQPVQDYINNLLIQSLNSIADGEAKTKGIALGAAAAQAIIQNRSNDGSANVMFPVTEGTQPGQYRFYFPFTIPPFELPPPFQGFYDSPGWGDISTFGIQNSTQFSVPAPYTVNSANYTADYNEVKRLGCANCTGINGRTSDQEDIARFWVESSPYGWNKIARTIIAQKNMNAWKVARVLALLQMTEADAYTACLKAKMIHFFWRPVTAINLGNNDGNPNTVGDPDWQVLVFPTPPVADHPSAHATAGGAAAELLKQVFEKDNFSFAAQSTTLPNKTRNFGSLSQAARENSLSRIYVGYHFRKACMDGEALGNSIGKWIATHSLAEN